MVFESGAPQADGTIAGNDADEDASSFEPHYDVISGAEQVQIYQPIMGNTDSEVTYTLLRAGSYLKDNRLLPEGFDKENAEDHIRARGAAADDDDFIGGSDQVLYEVDVAGAEGPFGVTAELLYQSLSYRFAVDLRQDEGELVDLFGDLYDAADKTAVVVDSADTTVE
jgi:hypothetical protein